MKILGGILGAILGALIGIGSGYAVAELLGIESRETQAYFQVLIAMPVGALLGLVTGAAVLGMISADRKGPLLVVGVIGSALLLGALLMGLRWSTPKRPAEVRVRNETGAALEQTYLGHDFRRATSLGSIAAGTTTEFHEVDLDERGSFNAVRGQQRGANFQLTLELERQNNLQAGRYTYVVRERDGQLELELRPEP